jgi:signal transduction histidine kinase/CheY-like chemotaxis protein
MVTQSESSISEVNLNAEIENLKRGLLPGMGVGALFVGYLWFMRVVTTTWPLVLNLTPAIAIFAGALLAHTLRKRWYGLACRLLLVGTVSFIVLISFAHPTSDCMTLGVLVIILASALVGTGEVFLLTLVMWGAATASSSFSMGVHPPDWTRTLDMLGLYILTLGATWLAGRPLRTSVQWMISSWHQSRKALLEIQQRRGELYRVVRALEEASYRLARMNNELLVAQREAEAARMYKSRFAAMVSHEIRGPLNLILGFSRMMALFPERYSQPLPADYYKDVDTIYRHSKHLSALVDDILDFTQLEMQKLPLVKDRVDIERDVVEPTIENIRSLAERKGLTLHYKPHGNLPWILADAVRLRQTVLNLLTNAVRLTTRGGIAVFTSVDGDSLRVSIQDTGPGIDPKELPSLFKEFHQLRTDQRGEQGSGLGLSICKHLVELHGGRIWVESTLGQGSTFHFTIPLPDAQTHTAHYIKTEETLPASLGNNHCLVVHSDFGVMRVLGRYLEGYRVIGTRNSNDVLRLVEQLHPRAVVTSHELREQVAACLAATAHDVPLISWGLPRLDTGNASTNLIGYLAKPVTPEMINSVMEQFAAQGEITVLLVDDAPDAVRLLEMMLTTLPRPYKILKAYGGQHAQDIMQEVVPQVVFLDLVMPRVDGKQVLAHMQADERLREVPVVVISGQELGDGDARWDMPILIQRREAMDATCSVQCLQSLLDTLKPNYLAHLTPAAPC